VVFAEWVGKIDPMRYIADYVYNSLKGVFGDAAAQAGLMQLQIAIALVKQNLANIPLMYVDNNGGVVGVVADGALVGTMSTLVQQLQQGNTQQAQVTLQQALVKSGLSTGTARQLALSIIQSIAQSTRTPPATSTTPQQFARTTYETEGKRGVVLISTVEYTTTETSTTEKATGRAVIQPKYVVESQSKTVTIPATEYKTEEKGTRETTRGRAVIQPKYVVEKSKRTILIPYKEYYVEETGAREATRGKVVPIVLPLITPVVIPVEENVEETIPIPPTPTPPTATPTPGFLPGGSPPTPSAPTLSKPPPRGRRQLEELEI
jgi:hypothetical protein